MPLTPHTKLGPFEILSPLGAGGMGEVYRARDARLGRDVAIKVLPEEFSQHPHKLARFEREARLLAALNHPGIATLHGLEEIEGKPFLVMELVEGETLAERIARGPLPVDEALTISQQIAEALEAAHEKGVIHRDLKPANIKVDPEGHVKVHDFGLAKLAEPESESPGEAGSQSPTLSRDATRAGVILGTAAYMSPEQAKGKTVDKRTDIFSFGIVLYEMLTGKGAFAGEDVSDVLAAVIRAEPDWSALPKDLAPRLEALLQRCLRKDRKLRRRDIGDVGLEIQEILANSGSGKTAAPGVALERTSLWRAVVLTAMASALITGVTVWSVRPPGPLPPSRFAVTLPASDRLVPSGLALSPDGRDLVYVGIRDGVTSLYRRSMDQLEVEPIRGTEGAEYPFFSPDGEWVGFFADDKLNKVSLAGGPSVALCDARNFRGASWGQDNFIVFAARVFPGLMRVSASGGVPEEVTIPQEASEGIHQWPDVLPGGKAVIFTQWSGSIDDAKIAVQSLETGERRMLVDGAHPRYAPTGHIVFARANSLWVIPFDSDRLEVTGAPTPVLEGIVGSRTIGIANFALAGDGSLVYVPGSTEGRKLVWVDREERVTPITERIGSYEHPRISPDGALLAVADFPDIWIYDIARDTMSRLTTEGNNTFPIWSPDGEWVAFQSDQAGDSDIYRRRADFSGTAEVLLTKEFVQQPRSWSPDGKLLSYAEDHPASFLDLWVLPLEGEREPRPIVQTTFREHDPDISPDGRWIAYESDESGQNEVYVQPFPDGGKRWPISTGGGGDPLWSASGRELFYLNGQKVMAVDVETEPELRVGRPRLLFEGSYRPGNQYDVALDGRFVMLEQGSPSDGTVPAELILVQNWFQELKRLVRMD